MSEQIGKIDDGNFEPVVLRSDRPVLVDFWAPWCAPCRRLAPIIEKVAGRYAGHVQFAKLNVDDSPGLAERHGIQGIPTLILFQNGAESGRIVGAASEDEISRMIDGHSGAAATREIKNGIAS